MKKFLIVAHYSRFLVQFELNDVKLLQGMGYEVHYATNFEHEDMYADAVQVIREHGVILHQVDFVRSPYNISANIKAYKQLKIDILGTVSFNELKELYTTNTIGVIPSLHEQCSYVAIEMSMFGMPMIVSDVDALSEMFEDEVNALRIPLVFDEDFGLELDEEKLADAIIRLIDDEALRLKLSTNAIKNYQERFTLEKMIENTINVYEQLIEQDNA